jgi:ketosteroid isomerase-like protein
MIDRQTVTDWLERYVAAWTSYDRGKIEDLFTEDAVYFAEPYADPLRGRRAIADAWLESPDTEDSWRADYRAMAACGDTGVGMGTSTYLTASGAVNRVFHNVFVLAFDEDGRCREYREWYMLQPRGKS